MLEKQEAAGGLGPLRFTIDQSGETCYNIHCTGIIYDLDDMAQRRCASRLCRQFHYARVS